MRGIGGTENPRGVRTWHLVDHGNQTGGMRGINHVETWRGMWGRRSRGTSGSNKCFVSQTVKCAAKFEPESGSLQTRILWSTQTILLKNMVFLHSKCKVVEVTSGGVPRTYREYKGRVRNIKSIIWNENLINNFAERLSP